MFIVGISHASSGSFSKFIDLDEHAVRMKLLPSDVVTFYQLDSYSWFYSGGVLFFVDDVDLSMLEETLLDSRKVCDN